MTQRQSTRRRAGGVLLRISAISLLLLVALCVLTDPVRSDEGQFRMAVEEYSTAMEQKDRNQRLQRFARAEQLFRQIIEGDQDTPPIRNTDLYVNLGNAALQAERIGPAVVAYRRALQLDPKHAQAIQNLDYARSLLPDWIRHEETSRLIDTLFFWQAMFSRGEILVITSVFFLVAALFFGGGHVSKQPILRNFALVPALGWLVLVGSLLVDHRNDSDRDVTVVSEAIVYSADSENSGSRLARPLPSGAEVQLLQRRDRWSEIQIPGGRSGWVLASAIEAINPQ